MIITVIRTYLYSIQQQMVFKCPKCPATFRCNQDLQRHLNRKKPCDHGKAQCEGCGSKYATEKALREHIREGRCKGKMPEARAEELAEEVVHLENKLDENKIVSTEMQALIADNTLLLQKNRHLTEHVELLQKQLQAISTDINTVRARFSFDVEDINFKGLYMIEIHGIILDSTAEEGSIVVKLGRATERTIGKRAHDTLKKHPNNRILYLRRCSEAAAAEDKLKVMLRTFRMLKSGSAPDGTHGIEFAAFQPGQAIEVKQMFDLAVFQAEVKSSNDEMDKLKLQLEILKEQRAIAEKPGASGANNIAHM